MTPQPTHLGSLWRGIRLGMCKLGLHAWQFEERSGLTVLRRCRDCGESRRGSLL